MSYPWKITTHAVGEEDTTTTTYGEEEVTSLAIGEEDATSDVYGEEDVTSYALGEEGPDVQYPVYQSDGAFGSF
jgi:hypothetical protein